MGHLSAADLIAGSDRCSAVTRRTATRQELLDLAGMARALAKYFAPAALRFLLA